MKLFDSTPSALLRVLAMVAAALLVISCGHSKSSKTATKTAASTQAAAATPAAAPAVQPVELKPRWRYYSEAGFDVPPAFADEKVFAADSNGILHAIDAATGKRRWHCQLGDRATSPPVIHQGMVYVGDVDGVLYAVDAAKGELRWKFESGHTIYAAATIIENGLLLANEAGDVILLNFQGQKQWAWTARNRLNAAAAIWNKLAIFAGCDGFIHGIDVATGNEELKIALKEPAGATPLIVGDVAIIGTGGGRILAINLSTGKEVWSYTGPAADMVYAAPVLYKKNVIVGIGDQLHAIDAATGQKKWVYQAGGDIEGTAAVAGNLVFVTSLDGRLAAINGDRGVEVAFFNAGAALPAGPVVAGGMLLIADKQGAVYCFSIR